MTARELVEARKKAIADARAVAQLAEDASRGMNAEENERYTAFLDDGDELDTRLSQQLRLEEAERRGREQRLDPDAGAGREDTGGSQTDQRARAVEIYGEHIADQIVPLMGDEYRGAFRRHLRTGAPRGLYLADGARDFRNLQADDSAKGGFAVAPEQFVADLIKAIDDEVFIRQWANTIPVIGSASLGRPSLDADPSDSDWTSELATGTEDSTMSFGKRELEPHPLAKRIKVSRKLLNVAALPIDQLVRERLAYKFGITQEKAFLLGTGSQQPLGVFVPTVDGISTGRDVVTGSTTGFTDDGLKNALYTLKASYWPRAKWLFHRTGMQRIAKLKQNGIYMLQPRATENEADRLFGVPAFVSEYVPNTFTAAQYVGILGDWQHYMIADSLLLDVQVLTELYAESNEHGYIGRAELDGMPVLEEAFVRLITDAS